MTKAEMLNFLQRALPMHRSLRRPSDYYHIEFHEPGLDWREEAGDYLMEHPEVRSRFGEAWKPGDILYRGMRIEAVQMKIAT